MRQVHEPPCPAEPAWSNDVLGDLRATCAHRHLTWKTLPARLVDQIDCFLGTPSAAHRLLHADLHSDHIFVHGSRLVGVIDWGDALSGDPCYELPALYFGTSRRSIRPRGEDPSSTPPAGSIRRMGRQTI